MACQGRSTASTGEQWQPGEQRPRQPQQCHGMAWQGLPRRGAQSAANRPVGGLPGAIGADLGIASH
jgi:hypothetical protein